MLDTEKAMQTKLIRDELKMLAQTIKRIKARQAKLRALLKDDTKWRDQGAYPGRS